MSWGKERVLWKGGQETFCPGCAHFWPVFWGLHSLTDAALHTRGLHCSSWHCAAMLYGSCVSRPWPWLVQGSSLWCSTGPCIWDPWSSCSSGAKPWPGAVFLHKPAQPWPPQLHLRATFRPHPSNIRLPAGGHHEQSIHACPTDRSHLCVVLVMGNAGQHCSDVKTSRSECGQQQCCGLLQQMIKPDVVCIAPCPALQSACPATCLAWSSALQAIALQQAACQVEWNPCTPTKKTPKCKAKSETQVSH